MSELILSRELIAQQAQAAAETTPVGAAPANPYPHGTAAATAFIASYERYRVEMLEGIEASA